MHLWDVPQFKRAMTFVFLARYVLGYKSQNQWKKFTETDLKFNQRCFKRWCACEDELFEKSPEYQKLGDAQVVKSPPAKRKVMSSGFSSNSPVKRVYVVNDESTDEEESS